MQPSISSSPPDRPPPTFEEEESFLDSPPNRTPPSLSEEEESQKPITKAASLSIEDITNDILGDLKQLEQLSKDLKPDTHNTAPATTEIVKPLNSNSTQAQPPSPRRSSAMPDAWEKLLGASYKKNVPSSEYYLIWVILIG